MSGSEGLTDRQREWLTHLRGCAESGETMSAYAVRNGLAVQAMYRDMTRSCG